MSKNDTKPKRHSYSIRPDLVEAIQAEVKRRHAHADTRYNPRTGKAWAVSDLVTEALENAFARPRHDRMDPSQLDPLVQSHEQDRSEGDRSRAGAE